MLKVLTLNNDFDLEYFFNLSPDLICVAGYDGYFKKINPAVSKTLGYTDEELFEKPINHFIHADDKLLTQQNRDNILNGIPLLNFENRYITKEGQIVWLTWTSVPVKHEGVVFAIAKNITYKKIESYRRLSLIKDAPANQHLPARQEENIRADKIKRDPKSQISAADQAWLSELETFVRKHVGKIDININLLSFEMAISERQLYRRIKSTTGLTPNQYIRIIRLQIAREAIETGKYRTISELAHLAGFETPTYFSKLFKEIYGSDIAKLL